MAALVAEVRSDGPHPFERSGDLALGAREQSGVDLGPVGNRAVRTAQDEAEPRRAAPRANAARWGQLA